MYKVYLAVGNEGVEKYIKSQKPLLEKMLNDTVNFVGVTVYKEGALQGIKDYHPDVVVLREGLQGNIDILDLIYKIRLESSNTRVIFITKTREVGDAFLAATVQMGVYDLIVGDKISVKDLLKKIVHPTKFIDVAHYIPKITVDERTSKTVFSAPNVDELVKQRVDEILEQREEEAAAANPSQVETQTSAASKLNPFKKPVDVGKPEQPVAPVQSVNTEVPPQTPYTDESEPVAISPVSPIQLEVEKTEEIVEEPPIQTPVPICPIAENDDDEPFDLDEAPITEELKPNPIMLDTQKVEEVSEPTVMQPLQIPVEKEPEPRRVAPIVIEDDEEDEEINIDTPVASTPITTPPVTVPDFGNNIQNSTFEDDEDEELPSFIPPMVAPIADSKPPINLEVEKPAAVPPAINVDIGKSEIPETPQYDNWQTPANSGPAFNPAPAFVPINPVTPISQAAPIAGAMAAGAVGGAVIAGMMQDNEYSEPSRITPTETTSEPIQNPYVLEPLVKPQKTEQKNTTSKKGFSLFKKKNGQKTVPAQIITFWGAGNGVGNSQIAFNAAISLANQGYHVLYADLNDKFSAIESMMQLGFEDLGIDTMLNNIEQGKNDKVGHAISSIAKILPFTDKRDFLYKTYTSMPSSLNFAFFSQHCFEHRTGIQYNVELIRDLNMMWLMDFGYDIIILDAPADATNRLTQLALAYANKVFITLNQDKTVLSRMLKQMKYLSHHRISIREKSYYIVNKFENNAFSYNNLQNFISMNLEYEKLELLSIPNLSKDFVNSIYNGTPIIFSCKNKELQKTIGDIVTLIES